MWMYMTSLVSDLLWGSSNTGWHIIVPMSVGFPAHKLSVELKTIYLGVGAVLSGTFLGKYCTEGNFRWCKFSHKSVLTLQKNFSFSWNTGRSDHTS